MSARQTPHTDVELLMADYFKRDADYFSRRSKGTGDWLLIFTVRGSGMFSSQDDRVFSRTGSAMLYPPGVAQEYRTSPRVGRWNLLWAHFRPRPHWSVWLDWPEAMGGMRRMELGDHEVARRVERALREMVNFRHQPFPWSLDLAMNALEGALIWIFSVMNRPALDARVLRAIGYLSERIREPLVVDDLARACGLSTSRLAHLFAEQVGLPPQRYQEQARLQRAAQLLRGTSLSVGEIAAECGYANAFYFSNRFKKAMGRSPVAFRGPER